MDVSRPDPIEYMLHVARTPSAVVYKTHVVAELALEPELLVVDVGCGPGTDLAAVAGLVAPGGLTLGVDVDQQMLTAAAGRVSPDVALLAADSHRLPLRSASVDRVRTDRALQHMHNPSQVLAEVHRVLRPGGRAVLAEPDWGTLVIDADRRDVSDRFVDFTCREVVRNSVIGRQIARLGRAAGFIATNVVPFPTVFRDFESADKIFGLIRNAHAAVTGGYLDADDARTWLEDLQAGPVLAAVTLFVTTLDRPGKTAALST